MKFSADNWVKKIKEYYNNIAEKPSELMKILPDIKFKTDKLAIYYFLKVISDKIINDLSEEEKIKYSIISDEEERQILINSSSLSSKSQDEFDNFIKNYITKLEDNLKKLENNFTELALRKYINIANELFRKISFFIAVNINIIPFTLNRNNEINLDHILSTLYITEEGEITSKLVERYDHFDLELATFRKTPTESSNIDDKILLENSKKFLKELIQHGKIDETKLTNQEKMQLIIFEKRFKGELPQRKTNSLYENLSFLFCSPLFAEYMKKNKIPITQLNFKITDFENSKDKMFTNFTEEWSKTLISEFLLFQESIYLNHDFIRYIFKNIDELYIENNENEQDITIAPFKSKLSKLANLFSSQFKERKNKTSQLLGSNDFLSYKNNMLKNLLFNYGNGYNDLFIFNLKIEYNLFLKKFTETKEDANITKIDKARLNSERIINARQILLHNNDLRQKLSPFENINYAKIRLRFEAITDSPLILSMQKRKKIFEEEIAEIKKISILYISAICKKPFLAILYERVNFYLDYSPIMEQLIISSWMSEKEIIEAIEHNTPIIEKALYDAIIAQDHKEIEYIKCNMQEEKFEKIKERAEIDIDISNSTSKYQEQETLNLRKRKNFEIDEQVRERVKLPPQSSLSYHLNKYCDNITR